MNFSPKIVNFSAEKCYTNMPKVVEKPMFVFVNSQRFEQSKQIRHPSCDKEILTFVLHSSIFIDVDMKSFAMQIAGDVFLI